MLDAVGDDTVWYVAYGSNLCRTRLQRYLDRVPGARGPLDDRATTLPHRLFFAHEATSWGGGGAAFLDPGRAGPVTLARAWRLTREQFVGVFVQENGRHDLAPVVDGAVLGLAPGAAEVALAGRYGLLIGCDSPDDRPALTFTTPAVPLPQENAPGARYVATIVEGLIESHGMSEDDARRYLTLRSP